MMMTSLRINQLSRSVSDWCLGPYLGSMDQLDIATYAGFLSDDVVMLFNNAPAIDGKVAAVSMLSGYWKSFASIEHEPLNIYGSDTAFVLEALNHYVRLDSKRVTSRAVAISMLRSRRVEFDDR